MGIVTQPLWDYQCDDQVSCQLTSGWVPKPAQIHWTQGCFIWGERDRDGVRFPHTTKNSAQIKTYKLRISEIFLIMFLKS